MDLSKYRHIVWDWNGTLLNDAWLCVEIVNRLLTERGKAPVTLEQYAEIFDFPVSDYYRKIGFDYESEPFEKLAIDFIEEYERRRAECRLQPGASEVLKALNDAGFAQSVLSAYNQIRLEEAVTAFGLRPFFSRLAGLDDHYAAGKAERGKDLLDLLDLPASSILLVGDTRHDYVVAGEMGIDCLLIPGGHCSKERLLSCDVPVLDSLSELAKRFTDTV